MEEKLGSILANPQMMSQIMSMAQALGMSQGAQPGQEPAPTPAEKSPEPQQQSKAALSGGFDGEILKKIVSATHQTGIDRNQQGLLRALGPYLSHGRIAKLEKAMRAARIAGFAAAALNSAGKGR